MSQALELSPLKVHLTQNEAFEGISTMFIAHNREKRTVEGSLVQVSHISRVKNLVKQARAKEFRDVELVLNADQIILGLRNDFV